MAWVNLHACPCNVASRWVLPPSCLPALLMTPKVQVKSLKSDKRWTVIAPHCTALIGGMLGLAWFILVLALPC